MPEILVCLRRDDTLVVVVLQRLPERRAVFHLIVPGHMMEPQQQVLRARLYLVIHRGIRLPILTHGIRSCRGAVEADTVLVCFVVIDRTPLQGILRLESVRLRTIVVIELEDMVQTERHHIVDTSLTALLHDSRHEIYEVLVDGERLLQPLPGNLLRCQRRVPCKSSEGIPVSL